MNYRAAKRKPLHRDKQMNTSIITLTTDFGTRDGFVGQMKGVILSTNPSCIVIDITHDIKPFAIREAALVIKGIWPYFPHGAIHLAVIDPGVGSTRRPIAVRTARSFFVGPDNGLFSYIFSSAAEWEAREITNEALLLPNPHPTFHGREVFAPVSAFLSAGKKFESLGPVLEDPVVLPCPAPQETSSGILGEVIYIDRFGNATTNIESPMLAHAVGDVQVGQIRISGISSYFAEVQVGMPLALINSFGFLEIAINGGHAAEELDIKVGDYVNVTWE